MSDFEQISEFPTLDLEVQIQNVNAHAGLGIRSFAHGSFFFFLDLQPTWA